MKFVSRGQPRYVARTAYPMFLFIRSWTLTGALLFLTVAPAPAGILEDRSIEDAIHTSFIFRELLSDPTMVQLHVRSGAVEVRGQVADEREHLLLEDLIFALPHVRKVDNRLFVDSAHRRATDRWLAARIRAHLLTQANIEVEELAVSVSSSTIQLTGRVRSDPQRSHVAAQVAAFHPGRTLLNQLEVAPDLVSPRRALDDPSVVALAWGALRDMSTLQLGPRAITCANGQISLRGTVAAPGDIPEVLRRLGDLRGVRLIAHGQIVRE
jgi:osmotically-inducible protein OsmY